MRIFYPNAPAFPAPGAIDVESFAIGIITGSCECTKVRADFRLNGRDC
ncbi:MAG: hypothetical protein FWD48_07230 [Oscillospiraceae bacterium]|nr:hypothetical protein [Oscillospiraceae bacterium]